MSGKQPVEPTDEAILKKYKYWDDCRASEQIQLTNHLARSLSQLNLQRTNRDIPKMSSPTRRFKKEDCLYVCISGIPVFQNEFADLGIPGQILHVVCEGFQPELTQQQRKDHAHYSPFEIQAHRLHQKIEKTSKDKPLVFIFHSYGTYIASTYFDFYGSERIVGLIGIGDAPIRFYNILKQTIKSVENVPMEVIEENLDQIFEAVNARNRATKMQTYKSKYNALSFLTSMKAGIGFAGMFQRNRRYPNVLKCFIYGRKDHIFHEQLVNEKVVYYSYQHKLPKEYEDRLIKVYGTIYQQKIDNIQQRFIFNIKEGYHSIHKQKKQVATVRKIIEEYLFFIQTAKAQQNAHPQPKL